MNHLLYGQIFAFKLLVWMIWLNWIIYTGAWNIFEFGFWSLLQISKAHLLFLFLVLHFFFHLTASQLSTFAVADATGLGLDHSALDYRLILLHLSRSSGFLNSDFEFEIDLSTISRISTTLLRFDSESDMICNCN